MAYAETDLLDEGDNWMVTYSDTVDQCVVHVQDDLGALLIGRAPDGVHHFNFFLETYIGENPQVMLTFRLPKAKTLGATRQLEYHKGYEGYHIYSFKPERKLIDLFWVGERLWGNEPGEPSILDVRIEFDNDMHYAFHKCIKERL